MFNLMQSTRYLVVLLASAFMTSGCADKVSFSSLPSTNTLTSVDEPYIDPDLPPVVQPPVVVEPPLPPVVVEPPLPPVVVEPPLPPVVVEPPVVPPLEPWTATCPAGRDGHGNLSSCLSCPSLEPDLSGKAKRLLDTMEHACQVNNKSAPKGYLPPTRAELMHRLRACSPQIYPDTVLTNEEARVIPPLATGDSKLLERMFGGLWYSADYSDAFDHYFGLGVEEAVPLFCYKTKTALTGELWSREMWDWSMRDYIWHWPKELQELHAYYQHVRSGLVACLDQEGTGGPSGSSNNGSATNPKCDAKGYKGSNRAELSSRLNELVNTGYTVSLENSVSCLIAKNSTLVDNGSDVITLAAIKCE